MVDDDRLAVVLAEAWGLELTRLHYVPKGFASYHWTGVAADGTRWFVKLDGLEHKPYLGEDPTSAAAGLEAAYATAHLLATAGLEFVVAPVPALDGRILDRIRPRWALSLFPFVAGASGRWGRRGRADARRRLIHALARLHGADSTASPLVTIRGWELPGRSALEAALAEVTAPWSGGPFSETARRALMDKKELVREWLAALDSLQSAVAAARPALVITHGEPHPGNVMIDGDQVRIIDWDTVALAPVERDLWMFSDDPALLDAYAAASGCSAHPTALSCYRLIWALSDLAAFTAGFRRPHDRNRATEHSWRGFLRILDGSEPAPYGPGRAAR
ncbi:MAG TPA: aminoglycoside phosphotransferase family protein [Acidimicrobiales bacterium]|nr:aminoglycoside phosphotransferase family protein [Acidimicrobiales bacterium]